MLRRVTGDNERVFNRKGRFEDILAPGVHWIIGQVLKSASQRKKSCWSARGPTSREGTLGLTARYFINVEQTTRK
jgi:hypothetical protein